MNGNKILYMGDVEYAHWSPSTFCGHKEKATKLTMPCVISYNSELLYNSELVWVYHPTLSRHSQEYNACDMGNCIGTKLYDLNYLGNTDHDFVLAGFIPSQNLYFSVFSELKEIDDSLEEHRILSEMISIWDKMFATKSHVPRKVKPNPMLVYDKLEI
jgi:hypothetical protein